MASDPLSQTFAALADPTRRAILTRLAEGSATVNELAAPFAISLPAISRHLKVLESAGLISREVEAQHRRCRIRPARLEGATDWIDRTRVFWEARFESLERHLERQQPSLQQE